VREVEHLGNAVHHRIAQGDDRVNAAQADPADEKIEKRHENTPIKSKTETETDAKAPRREEICEKFLLFRVERFVPLGTVIRPRSVRREAARSFFLCDFASLRWILFSVFY
jgi:hypothetical protein